MPAKLGGYYRWLKHEYSMFCFRRMHEKKSRVLQAWLQCLNETPPEVLLGANFAAFGGVKHHIQAIQRNSSLNCQLLPPPEINEVLSPGDFMNDFRDQMFTFEPIGVKVLHSHVYPWYAEWCRQKRNANLRWIHTYHLMYYPEHGNGVIQPWQQEINESLTGVASEADIRLSVSKWQCEELREKYGIESHYLPNGVDVSICDAASPTRFQKKQHLDRFILYVGRNDPVKNPVDFVKLANQMPDQQFVMLGGGLSCRTLMEDWKITVPANLRVLGAQNLESVQDAIAACSVLVVTSWREGMPTLVLEGMASNTPLVVSDEPGSVEAIGNGEFGEIYSLENIDDLECKVRKQLELGRRDVGARKRVLDEYDWRAVTKNLDIIYSGSNAG